MLGDSLDGAHKTWWQRAAGLLPEGPRLQFLNLLILFSVVVWTLDYPNPVHYVAFGVLFAALLDGLASRMRFGGWRIPWPSMVAALGASLLIDAHGFLPFVLLPILMVGSKHLIRWRGRHLFNPNNFAVALLILGLYVRVGVNDWGAAPQAVALLLLFGITATYRVRRLDLAVTYLALSFVAYWVVASWYGWGMATVWAFALSPVQIMIGFFAITDPATSPTRRAEKMVWAALVVLIAIPATLAGRVEAPIFALLVAAPQRHVIAWLFKAHGRSPRPESHAPSTTGVQTLPSAVWAPAGDDTRGGDRQ